MLPTIFLRRALAMSNLLESHRPSKLKAAGPEPSKGTQQLRSAQELRKPNRSRMAAWAAPESRWYGPPAGGRAEGARAANPRREAHLNGTMQPGGREENKTEAEASSAVLRRAPRTSRHARARDATHKRGARGATGRPRHYAANGRATRGPLGPAPSNPQTRWRGAKQRSGDRGTPTTSGPTGATTLARNRPRLGKLDRWHNELAHVAQVGLPRHDAWPKLAPREDQTRGQVWLNEAWRARTDRPQSGGIWPAADVSVSEGLHGYWEIGQG